MDIVVTPSCEETAYRLTDRLGRPAGEIEKHPRSGFTIRPKSGGALGEMTALTVPTLDEAMSAIEKHTKGACQLAHAKNRDDKAVREDLGHRDMRPEPRTRTASSISPGLRRRTISVPAFQPHASYSAPALR